ncbi:calyx/polyhedral envelope protein [Spodoptera exempta nucleopolyhedrovirus]|uniref:Calyx/polyhedral envelope protein n=1 Tax=Spodoptera exempta nucleopolyhedrovirus TaxID=1242863 RepID=A0A410S7Y9_9ABAC|nr:calyx/polyhedral envelope protein [Spodoptera exempta nucleopolyhedrovirus]QAT90328.1 calyx/polyhedral envelope protein [Spodoptera exempta nucleopolyhedrovirus]
MSLITKKCQDINVSAYFDQFCVLWVSADDVLHLLRLPVATLQTIQQRHKKCWVDFRCQQQHHCSHDANKVFIDLYGLGNLCNRVNSQIADYLMTVFVSEVYTERRRNSRRSCSPRRASKSPSRRRSNSPRRRSSGCRRRSRRSRSRSPRRCCPSQHHHHHNHQNELLDRIARQNDLIASNINQLTMTNSNQHLELSNLLNTIRLQNTTIANQVAQILENTEGLGEITGDFTRLLAEIDTRLATLTTTLLNAINQLSEQLRSDLTGINAILNNLSSSVTNINATLNNLLQAINGLNVGGLLTELQESIASILQLLESILGILQPLNKK